MAQGKGAGMRRILSAVFFVAQGLFAVDTASAAAPAKPGHVFVIVLENEGYHITFGRNSPAKFLKGLVGRGAVLPNFYGIGHFSLDNYIAMVSGQAPNPVTQSDCQSFTEFTKTGMAAEGQLVGSGCVYPTEVKTIANQLEAKGLTWKGYMEDMGNIPAREAATCGHPELGTTDKTQRAVVGDQYATRHNPFMYFHAIIDSATCDANVVALPALKADLQSVTTTANFVFITPNLCHDGHDGGENGRRCVDGQPGGLVSADTFLADTVPAILVSPAFKQGGLLIVTFDEADIEARYDKATNTVKMEEGDASACCDEPAGPNIGPDAKVFGNLPDKGPGVLGPGGGRIGAVLISPFIKPGTVSKLPYNHYSLLRSLEDMFGLDHLGYAGQAGLRTFGPDIFGKPTH
jgi:hypothetical protein